MTTEPTPTTSGTPLELLDKEERHAAQHGTPPRLGEPGLIFAGMYRQLETTHLEQADDLRGALIEALGEGISGIELAARCERLIQVEARVKVYGEAVQVATHHGDAEARPHLLRWAVSLLARGADDQWSGRINDARRLAYDATRDAVERIVGAL